MVERFARRAGEFADLQNEVAGRDVGRNSRFLSADAKSSQGSEKREARKEAALTALQAALANQAYAELFQETHVALSGAQSRLHTLLERVHAQIEQIERGLADKLERAASLPDGTKVFRDQNGNVRTQDGAIIAAELAATIIWRGDEPSFEEMQADDERLDRLENLEGDIRSGQMEIGDMQAAMDDDETPPRVDDLQGFTERADEIADDLERQINRIAPSAEPQPANAVGGSTLGVTIPEI